MSLLIDKLEGYNVKFKQRKPVPGFRYPVFEDEDNKIFYYVIEKPTNIMKDKVEYIFKEGIPEPKDGVEYVALSRDMMVEFSRQGPNKKIFVMLKGPTLDYVKGFILDIAEWKKGTFRKDKKIYLGEYVSNRNYNFKSHMFATSEMTFIKKDT